MSTPALTVEMDGKTHAILDGESRQKKAQKIELLTQMFSTTKMSRIIEIGCGSGHIIAYFARAGYGKDGTYGVDVADERQTFEEFEFQVVEDTTLPFQDGAFDFAMSNHVIEHVGERADQVSHLAEIYRCLEPGGTLYLAVPNLYCLIEPHYRLPFLSWLPRKLANQYMRFFGKGDEYDCRLLSNSSTKELLKQAGFDVSNATLSAIPLTAQLESGFAMSVAAKVPTFFWRLCTPIMPTLIYVCRKPLP